MKHRVIGKLTLVAGVLGVLMAVCAPLAAAAPYKVSTNAATKVGAYSATLNGSVYVPDGGKVSAGFQYGLTTEYGSDTEVVRFEGKYGWAGVPVVIEGLQPETTYHFKFGAMNYQGELSEGGDVSFTTSSAARFEAASYPASISAEQRAFDPVSFSIENGTIACQKTGATGSLAATATTLTLTPTFSDCEVMGFLEGSVVTNGCTYVVHAGDSSTWTSTMDIVCPAGKAIEAKSGTCAVSIPAQSGLRTQTSNETFTDPDSIELGFGASNLRYTKTKDGFLCPFNGTGTKENGGISGSELLTATKSGTPILTKIGY